MPEKSVETVSIVKMNTTEAADAKDLLAVEEPMEIRLDYMQQGNRVQKNISVTMRTPGNDEELTTGFLYTEGVIRSAADIASISRPKANSENIIVVSLADGVQPTVGNLDRNFYTTSSCGVCGKASIESVRLACPVPDVFDNLRIPPSLIYQLPDLLRKQQNIFENTGGLHGCALFDSEGNLLFSREDVGRHNALDKLVGVALNKGLVPLNNHILLLSGRASFELVQKSVMAGIKIVAAVGAPSSLAAEMATEWGMTLIGFLRGERFNIYSGAERILI